MGKEKETKVEQRARDFTSTEMQVMDQKRTAKTEEAEPYLVNKNTDNFSNCSHVTIPTCFHFKVPSKDDTDDSNPYTSLLVPNPSSEYAVLGEIDAINLLSFAYQIASGMVRLHIMLLLMCTR